MATRTKPIKYYTCLRCKKGLTAKDRLHFDANGCWCDECWEKANVARWKQYKETHIWQKLKGSK